MRDVLRAPGALSLFVSSCVARLPMGALGLLLVLHTQQITGSYARGGLASGTYAIALGLSNPLLARVVDRRGQTLVLRIGAPLAAAAIVALALLPDGAPLGAILAAAACAGMFQPPVGACMRALWPELLDGPDRRHAAYALEGAVLEIVYICGPVAIVAGIGSWSTTAALIACATFLFVGDLVFSSHPLSRAWQPHPERVRDLTGALRGSGVRVLVAVFALCGLAVGAVEVVVPAALDATGNRELTGLLLGMWGVVGASGEPVALALLLLVAGATIAPTFVCANGMLDDLAPPGTLTEAFTWTSTGISVGIAAGSALAGVLVEAGSPAVAMAVLGAGGVLAALVVRAASAGPLRAAAPAPA
jgi:MFS family permease